MTPEDKKRLESIRREVANATPGLLSDFEFLLAQLDAFPKAHGVITCEEAERGINLLLSKLDEARELLDEGARIVDEYAPGFTVWPDKDDTGPYNPPEPDFVERFFDRVFKTRSYRCFACHGKFTSPCEVTPGTNATGVCPKCHEDHLWYHSKFPTWMRFW